MNNINFSILNIPNTRNFVGKNQNFATFSPLAKDEFVKSEKSITFTGSLEDDIEKIIENQKKSDDFIEKKDYKNAEHLLRDNWIIAHKRIDKTYQDSYKKIKDTTLNSMFFDAAMDLADIQCRQSKFDDAIRILKIAMKTATRKFEKGSYSDNELKSKIEQYNYFKNRDIDDDTQDEISEFPESDNFNDDINDKLKALGDNPKDDFNEDELSADYFDPESEELQGSTDADIEEMLRRIEKNEDDNGNEKL